MRWLSVGLLLFAAGCVHRTTLMDLQDCLARNNTADNRRCDKEYNACVENFGKAQCAKDANAPDREVDDEEGAAPRSGEKQKPRPEDE